MSDSVLATRSPLAGIAIPGHHGASGEPGVLLSEISGAGLFSVAVLKGQGAAFARIVRETAGLKLPEGPACVSADGLTVIGAGPGQWLLFADAASVDACDRLRQALVGMAAIVDQSDARAMIKIGGSRARDALAKGVSVDLHPKCFGPGAAAVTSVALMGVTLWRPDDEPVFMISVARSMAGSFWHWLADSSAEFGYQVG